VLEDWCQPFPGFFIYYPSRRQQPASLSVVDQRPSTVIESGELSTRSVCVVWNAHRRVYNHNEWQLGTVSFSTEFYGALLLAGPTLWHG
jgi:hypothetical protein